MVSFEGVTSNINVIFNHKLRQEDAAQKLIIINAQNNFTITSRHILTSSTRQVHLFIFLFFIIKTSCSKK